MPSQLQLLYANCALPKQKEATQSVRYGRKLVAKQCTTELCRKSIVETATTEFMSAPTWSTNTDDQICTRLMRAVDQLWNRLRRILQITSDDANPWSTSYLETGLYRATEPTRTRIPFARKQPDRARTTGRSRVDDVGRVV